MSLGPLAGDYRFPSIRASAHPYNTPRGTKTGSTRASSRPVLQKPVAYDLGALPCQRTGRKWLGTESPSSPTQFSFANGRPAQGPFTKRVHSLDYSVPQDDRPSSYTPWHGPSLPAPSESTSFPYTGLDGQGQHQLDSLPFRTRLQGKAPSMRASTPVVARGGEVEGQLGVEHGWREQAVPRPSRAIQVPSVLLPKHKRG